MTTCGWIRLTSSTRHEFSGQGKHRCRRFCPLREEASAANRDAQLTCRLHCVLTQLRPPRITEESALLIEIPDSIIRKLSRHMALRHSTRSIITSHIPWNTSSALSLLVVPKQTPPSPPPPCPRIHHTLSLLHPPPHGAYPRTSVAPAAECREAGSQSFPLSCLLLICLLTHQPHWIKLSCSCLVSEGSTRAQDFKKNKHNPADKQEKPGETDSITPMRDMGGKEKKILVIANVYQGSDKKCNESVSGKKNGNVPSVVPPPIPMSPIVEKMEGLKSIRNRSNSLRLGRLAFYRHLEKVETLRCFWELKHVELEGGKQQAKDDKDKAKLKGLKAQKKRKPPDTSDSLNEPVLQEQVEKLNRQNTENSHGGSEADGQRGEDRGSGGRRQELGELILDGPHTSDAQPEEDRKKTTLETEEAEEEEGIFEDSEHEEEGEKLEEKSADVISEQSGGGEDDGKKRRKEETKVLPKSTKGVIADVSAEICKTSPQTQESSDEVGDVATCSKRRVTEEDVVKDDLKKSRVEDSKVEDADGKSADGAEPQAAKSDDVKAEVEAKGKEEESAVTEFIIDLSPPPSAPFDHRIVTPKPHQIATYYTINRDEVLGGGRFGQVHKCIENSSGLTLAAKIIKAKSQKEKEVVRNEIQVMNQLSHSNLIQLYAAFESRHDIILVMEYVEGGELFDRIIDENYNLTELDTVLFIRQICEGLQYMHKMYILHLDLKPENILCVSRATNKIKIIDFGLARRYKPREKLRVNFGTPEFLAPEVINYEFVSFPTDMWSLGVITYMLLSGLSPFLGDDDNETLNNILACQWNFEEEEFSDISDEAKDFITRLLVKSKSWRMSAAESLRHPWLSDQSLHQRLHLKKNKCHSTHAPSPES